MAGKARRVASRQSQLSRKRKRQQKSAAGPLSAINAPVDVDGEQAETSTARVVEPTLPPPTSAPVVARPTGTPDAATLPTPAPRARGRIRGERPATRNYIVPELRRILFLATTVLVIIIVLGIIL